MHLGFKYRVYPTEEQKVFFAKSFGCCRKVWNLMLADKNNHYKETGKTLHPTPAQYKKRISISKRSGQSSTGECTDAVKSGIQKLF